MFSTFILKCSHSILDINSSFDLNLIIKSVKLIIKNILSIFLLLRVYPSINIIQLLIDDSYH